MSDLVQIDGSYGEGGGQVLRTCLSLSALDGRPFEMQNVRAGRDKPGLKPQHLAAVRAAAKICGAEVRGDAVGSMYLRFEPTHRVRPDDYFFDIGTAGSTTLVAQTVLLPLAHSGGSSKIVVRGGTHNPLAPTADYLEEVYAATLRAHGYVFRTSYDPAGFYPRGGGELTVQIEPCDVLRGFKLIDRDEVSPMAITVLNNLPNTVAERGENTMKSLLPQLTFKRRTASSESTGAAITIVAGTAGFCSLGERGKPMEAVALGAARQATEWLGSGAAVDEHLADQLVPPAVIAGRASTWRANRVTEHLRTVLWTCSHFRDFSHELDEDTSMVRIGP